MERKKEMIPETGLFAHAKSKSPPSTRHLLQSHPKREKIAYGIDNGAAIFTFVKEASMSAQRAGGIVVKVAMSARVFWLTTHKARVGSRIRLSPRAGDQTM